jgi:hypothetical protein
MHLQEHQQVASTTGQLQSLLYLLVHGSLESLQSAVSEVPASQERCAPNLTAIATCCCCDSVKQVPPGLGPTRTGHCMSFSLRFTAEWAAIMQLRRCSIEPLVPVTSCSSTPRYLNLRERGSALPLVGLPVTKPRPGPAALSEHNHSPHTSWDSQSGHVCHSSPQSYN